VSTDALQTFLKPGDQGFENPEKIFGMGTSFNTGAGWLRMSLVCAIHSAEALGWSHDAWDT